MPRTEPIEFLPHMPARLRELRVEMGWTLDELAERLGVTHRAVVSNWEATNQRRRIPDINSLLGLQRWYGVSMDYLMGQPGADRDSPAVRLGKRALREALQSITGLENDSPSERAVVAIGAAGVVAPDAFFTERMADSLFLTKADLEELTKGGTWPGPTIDRLSNVLGLKEEWFYAPDPQQVLEAVQ